MYIKFIDWCDARGLDFPCTSDQFVARVTAFLGNDWTQDAFNALLRQGGVDVER